MVVYFLDGKLSIHLKASTTSKGPVQSFACVSGHNVQMLETVGVNYHIVEILFLFYSNSKQIGNMTDINK